ncbi:calmodulin-binding protein 25-like [Zingiber officinale]|uniref:VQ domain-containing protein n=1 Tax=Zingiber officinale TaxID=94328 RepID=A0A8J5BUJ9_ZINOF|nr:calmodulin-binding protein 25-like [Zingiber officinale]XP_042452564.1 calmodulin-binding protein 25-like [Zingiber officinale]KAG6466466.1 hypothetical protein ZIOFF_075734 [Zingiber officinale]KAG6500844.1 hypothetical protein ZIOFF_040702 [Zingiber officinale]
MAENCSVLDLWARRPDSAWISEVSARENAALTRALQMSLSDTTTTTTSTTSSSSSASSLYATDTISSAPMPYRVIPSSPTPSDASAGDASLRRGAALGPSAAGRVSKRKTRTGKRADTTYIKVDLENFREMVQRVTGIRGDWEPSESAVEPEPVRPAAAALQQICLPTLDTSAILLGKSSVEIAREGGGSGFFGCPPPTPAEMPAFDLDFLVTAFPTLDSWGVL